MSDNVANPKSSTPVVPTTAVPLAEGELGARLHALGEALKSSGCNSLAISVATQIVHPNASPRPGTRQNVLNAMPHMRAADGQVSIQGFATQADRNADGNVDTDELMAILMAGVNRAQQAKAKDIAAYIKEIKPDAGFLAEVDNMCEKIQVTSCGVPQPASKPIVR